MRGVDIARIKCWNMSSVIDNLGNLYVWGMLSSVPTNSSAQPHSLCIKKPEKVSSFRFCRLEVGPSMALGIAQDSMRALAIGVNSAGELGVGD